MAATKTADSGLNIVFGQRDAGLAIGVVAILAILFLPLPSFLIDAGLALSIALSILILMVALWIRRPLEFSAFPTILLIATLLRLALNVATTRLILSHGAEGPSAAGHVIEGFAQFVMGGDFVIGVIVFIILITVNFVVITKGATRIAEVGARFTLDSLPGKQMAVDADLSSGAIDEKEAIRRRKELEEESQFFGAMDGASKFVRGDAIAGLIITAVNIFGGIIIGVTRHDLPFDRATDTFVKLSIGDGLVTQMPALIVALAAGLLVSKGGTRGSTEGVIVSQFGNYPRALVLSGGVMGILALAPGLPFLPFAAIGGLLGFVGVGITRQRAALAEADADAKSASQVQSPEEQSKQSIRDQLRTTEIEICFGKQISSVLMRQSGDLPQRVAKMRRKFAKQYGFVVPEMKLTEDLSVPPKSYQIKVHGTVVASAELRLGDVLVVVGDGPKPDTPGDETREPAFGMKAIWVPDIFTNALKRDGFVPVENTSVLLTHIAEVIRNSLAQLLSYRDLRSLLDRLDPEYRKLLDEICPAQISHSGLQSVLKMLLGERISIRNLHLILEAVAEIAPFTRKAEQITEHVRMRLAAQICGDLSEGNYLKVVRLGNRWETEFHQALRRDAKGDVIEFDIDPRLIEQFSGDLSRVIQPLMDAGHQFVLVTAADTRPYVHTVTERLYGTLSVLSHLEISRGVQIQSLGSVS
ncbi:flagellar biosynthesis protein FlhA [Hyphomicrobium methylovorum]|uniref:flagellar biosynthesis protein FlhA n=1 Tax=Hyphomicrobium methylovorum TaxID=84 RepID=UPI0015E63E9B|nr:flagellar biosynthesis protein FlhA [Hyphomicrobium methylovorum]MBA2125919.1 flagellar biosynthesis protein FlhA [Hyphomicrobium methylovorum]